MKFRVIDNKTGKEADAYEIALHEEWAQSLVYCDMEGFMLTENGDLMLADECGTYVYCDPERFKVVFEDERPHGEWIYHAEWEVDGECPYECSKCGIGSDVDYDFCPGCGLPMTEKALEILRKREGEKE